MTDDVAFSHEEYKEMLRLEEIKIAAKQLEEFNKKYKQEEVTVVTPVEG
jgi:hypothetical protein